MEGTQKALRKRAAESAKWRNLTGRPVQAKGGGDARTSQARDPRREQIPQAGGKPGRGQGGREKERRGESTKPHQQQGGAQRARELEGTPDQQPRGQQIKHRAPKKELEPETRQKATD